MNWNHFDQYQPLIDKYMPAWGEGETLASQACTAVNKLVYKWFNDGDVFDCAHLSTCNDLSSYANWLDRHIDEAKGILEGVYDAYDDEAYEALLARLCEAVIQPDVLAQYADSRSEDSIYKCNGPYTCDEDYEEEDYEDEEDEEEEEYDEEDE